MPSQPLNTIPPGSNVFIDANIIVYGINEESEQCKQFLDRCSREEIFGICLFEILNEATHQFMRGEARAKGLPSTPNDLRRMFNLIAGWTDYWKNTERVLGLNLLFLSTDESIVRLAQSERQNHGLLTNDSMIVSCMHKYGIDFLATSDRDFERVTDIIVFRPDDLP